MNHGVQKLVAVVVAVASGVAALVIMGVLTAQSLQARADLEVDEARVEELTEQARTDAAFADVVHTELERQTADSLVREVRKSSFAPVLVIVAVVFLAACKWLVSLRGPRIVMPPKLYQLTVSESEPGKEPGASGTADSISLPVLEEIDVSAVDGIIARLGDGPASAIPILQAVQEHYRYLPEAALQRVCELTEISAGQLAGVATFYTQFRSTPVGEHLIKVCHGTACHVAGAERITDELRRRLGIGPGEDTDPKREFTIEPVACMGCCTLAPVAQFDDETHGHLQSHRALELLAECRQAKSNGQAKRTVVYHGGDGSQPPAGEIRIGLGSCCVANGSGKVHEALQGELDWAGVNTAVKRVGCVGMCHQTPLVEIDLPGGVSVRYARVQAEHVKEIVRRHYKPASLARRVRQNVNGVVGRLFDSDKQRMVDERAIELRDPPVAAFLGPQKHIATEYCGDLDPCDLDEYIRQGGFEGLRRCVEEMSPEEVVEEVHLSGLRGRGGGGFPSASKWDLVRGVKDGQKYIICNGDEGDPGAFMDRMLMESYPYRIIEGIAIAAFAVGATEGYFYIRREYPLAVRRIREALEECERRGILGEELLGGDGGGRKRPPLRLRIMEGAGAFVCGEETALIASIEGRRGMPTLRPPYPAECGLWGRPTLVNNVESYAVVPWIFRNGAEAFAALGTESSKGTKVFALAGKVARGGLIEVPMGVTIREIVEQIGGGVKDEETAAGIVRHSFKAVQIGGPSGGCVPAEMADTPVDFEALASVGAIMGSGGLVVMDETDCMVDIARYFLSFTQDQSCGKCTPCRVGTRRMLEILERLCEGQGRRDDVEELETLARMVGATSICGLGQTAPNPILTTLRYYREEYEAHLEGRCPAGKCKALIRYEITDDCTGCTLCAQHCPADAIPMTPYEIHAIDDEVCTRCDTCRVTCPEGAIRII